MEINTTILLITVTMLFHGAIISMEKDTFDYSDAIKSMQIAELKKQEMSTLLKKQIAHINSFVQKNEHDPQHMMLLEIWLIEQSEKISDDKIWKILIKNLTSNVISCRCLCQNQRITKAIKSLVIEYAQNLKSGQARSQSLVKRAQETILQIKNDTSTYDF